MNYYKFNVTDPFNFTDETAVNSFNLTEDSVSVTIDSSASNDSVSVLNETAILRFRLRDDDYGVYPDGVKGWVWITENGKDYTKILNCSTSNGYCQVSYDPTPSSEFGTQYWKGGTSDSCYEHGNSTNETIEIVNPVSSIRMRPLAVINGSDVNLSASVYNFQALWANVTLPNATVQKLLMANNANTSFSATGLTGRYNVTFYANDSKGEAVNRSGYYFESFTPIVFNVSVVDYLSAGVDTDLTFYYRNESIGSNSSANGSHSSTTVDSVVDVELRGFASRLHILLREINVSSENNKTFGMDKHTGTSGYLVTYGINSTYNMTSALVKIYYDDTGYSDENNLQLHKCDNYDFTSRTCSASWIDVTSNSTQNKTYHFFRIYVTSFSGFSIKQYVAPYEPPSGPSGGSACSINWSCGEWGSCLPNGTQVRTCVDLGTCRMGNRTEYGNCSYIPTCSDNILNQDESDTDCGGSCPPCGEDKACRTDSDCQSGFCDQGICRVSAAPPEEGEKPSGEEKREEWYIEPYVLGIMAALVIVIMILISSLIYLLSKETGKRKGGQESSKLTTIAE